MPVIATFILKNYFAETKIAPALFITTCNTTLGGNGEDTVFSKNNNKKKSARSGVKVYTFLAMVIWDVSGTSHFP